MLPRNDQELLLLEGALISSYEAIARRERELKRAQEALWEARSASRRLAEAVELRRNRFLARAA